MSYEVWEYKRDVLRAAATMLEEVRGWAQAGIRWVARAERVTLDAGSLEEVPAELLSHESRLLDAQYQLSNNLSWSPVVYKRGSSLKVSFLTRDPAGVASGHALISWDTLWKECDSLRRTLFERINPSWTIWYGLASLIGVQLYREGKPVGKPVLAQVRVEPAREEVAEKTCA